MTVHFVDGGVDTGPSSSSGRSSCPTPPTPTQVLERAAPDRARAAVGGGAADRARARSASTRPTRVEWSSHGRLRAYGGECTADERAGRRRPRRSRSSARCCRSRTRRGSSSSPAAWPSSGSRSSPPAAPPGRSTEAGIRSRSISDLTGFPEIMDGRVKTLHPKLYAGLLAVRDNAEHLAAAEEHEVEFVDLVCVNLYPFERTAAQRGAADDEVIENIDIGGPTMIRAAAKNHAFAAPVVARRATTPCSTSCASPTAACRPTRARAWPPRRSPTPRATTPRSRAGFRRSARTSRRCSCAPSRRCSSCPTARTPTSAPPTTSRSAPAPTCCRWSPSSAASRSRSTTCSTSTPAGCCWREFQIPACVIIKHNNPCGVAVGSTALEAYQQGVRLRSDVGVRRRSCA